MQNVLFLLSTCAWFGVLGVTDHYLPWVSWHAEALAWISAVLATLGMAMRGSLVGQFQWSKEIWFFVAMWMVLVVQAMTGQLWFWGDVWVWTLYITLLIMGITLGRSLTPRLEVSQSPVDAKANNYVAALIALWALLLLAEGLAQALNVWDAMTWFTGIGPKRRPGGNLAQPNHYGTFMVLGIASLMYLHKVRSIHVGTLLAGVLMCVAGAIVSESRTALLSLAVLSLWHIHAHQWSWGQIFRKSGYLVILAGGYWVWPIVWNIVQMNSETGAIGAIGVNGTSSGRLELWRQTLEMVKIKPWEGWGARQFQIGQTYIAASEANVLNATYAHNLVLDLIVWFGVPVGGVFGVSMLSWLVVKVKKVRDAHAWFAIALLLPIAIHALLEYAHAYTYFLFPASIAVGLLSEKSGKVVSRKGQRLHLALVLTVSLLATAIAWEYFKLEEDIRVARFDSVRVGQMPEGFTPTPVRILTQLEILRDAALLKPRKRMPENEIEKLRQAATYYPWPATITKYAVALAMQERTDELARQLRITEAYFGDGGVFRSRLRISEAMTSNEP